MLLIHSRTPLEQTVWVGNTLGSGRLSTTNLMNRKNGNVCWRLEYDTKAFAVQGQAANVSEDGTFRINSNGTRQLPETSVSEGRGPIKEGGRSSATPWRKDLLPHYHDDERIRLHLAAALAGSGRVKIRRRKEDVVRLEVEAHGACAALGRNIFDDRVLVR